MCVFHSSSLEESYLLQLDRDGGRGISRLGVEILCWVSIKICLFIVATEGFTSHSQTLLIQFYPPKYIRVIYVCDTVKKQRLYHV